MYAVYPEQPAQVSQREFPMFTETDAPTLLRLVTEVHPRPVSAVGKRAASGDEPVRAIMSIEQMEDGIRHGFNQNLAVVVRLPGM